MQNLKNRKALYIFPGIILALFFWQYFGVIKAEISYFFRNKGEEITVTLPPLSNESAEAQIPSDKVITAKDPRFALVIPKIGVNVKIIPDVDPFDAKVYQKALSQGVAHAVGTSTPSEGKNTVLFAHSTDNFYNANKYNAVFYLLGKLKVGDGVFVVEDGKIYEYAVVENSVVEPEEIGYMEQDTDDVVTLITCWPAGATLKRRVVVAGRV